jgi:FkbM family methyltransferase
MKTKEFFLVRLLHISLRREQLAYPPLTMHFYAYTQFVSLFEDIFIDHLYYHPVLRKRGARIAVGGAHMGMFSAYCHWMNTTAHITAFEADPVTFSLLTTNAEQNGWTKTTCINAALAGTKGSAWFYFDPTFPSSFVSSMFQERGLGGKKRIQTVTLSSHYRTHVFDYVKLDIEGAEYAVLRDLIRTHVFHKTKVYIIEFHHNISKQKEQFSRALTELAQYGFIYSLRSEKPANLFQYQDVMVYAEKR